MASIARNSDGSWGDAAAILSVHGVVEDRDYYGSFGAPEQRAVQTIPQRIQQCWFAGDANAFADVFATDGSLLMQDTQLLGREEIREYMAAGFEGPLWGARVAGGPLALEFVDTDVAVLVTHGGILLKGEERIDPSRRIRAMWVIGRRSPGELELLSHHSSPRT